MYWKEKKLKKKKPNFFSYFLVNRINSNMQGVANRGCSVRVGRETEKQGKGITTDHTKENVG